MKSIMILTVTRSHAQVRADNQLQSRLRDSRFTCLTPPKFICTGANGHEVGYRAALSRDHFTRSRAAFAHQRSMIGQARRTAASFAPVQMNSTSPDAHAHQQLRTFITKPFAPVQTVANDDEVAFAPVQMNSTSPDAHAHRQRRTFITKPFAPVQTVANGDEVAFAPVQMNSTGPDVSAICTGANGARLHFGRNRRESGNPGIWGAWRASDPRSARHTTKSTNTQRPAGQGGKGKGLTRSAPFLFVMSSTSGAPT
ncbi:MULTISPECIES: hypothetical protein [unclassified Burkholderia]|uniref:hypothetical protein n=1 Tax=unclassified Burkholderia TaxID=2613784 RepID=UPI002AB1C283|nr:MULTISPECIES: hypothetical protein [unclassified Burkholderia]